MCHPLGLVRRDLRWLLVSLVVLVILVVPVIFFAHVPSSCLHALLRTRRDRTAVHCRSRGPGPRRAVLKAREAGLGSDLAVGGMVVGWS
jgi:hypothetical protein